MGTFHDPMSLAVNGERVCVPSEVHPSTRLIDFIRTRTRFRVSVIGNVSALPAAAALHHGCEACHWADSWCYCLLRDPNWHVVKVVVAHAWCCATVTTLLRVGDTASVLTAED